MMNSGIALNADSAPAVNPEAKVILERYLIEGEALQWCDKPQMRWKREVRRVLPIVAFVLMLFLIIFANFLSEYRSGTESRAGQGAAIAAQQEENPKQQEHKSSLVGIIFASAFFSLFFAFWCYMMFMGMGGRNLLHISSLSKTYYGLTNFRLIMVSGKKDFRALSYHLRTIENLRMQEETDGFGTIKFGPRDLYRNPFQSDDIPPLILKNIPRAAYVFSLIFKTQDKLLRP
jgi:hypothetical protein